MVESAVPPGADGRPHPDGASTAREFIEDLRRLKKWSGAGYRLLEKRARAAGHALPRSTATAVLSRFTLPREDFVVAFTYACGCEANEVSRWVVARRRIAAHATTPPPTQSPVQAADGRAASVAAPEPARCTLPPEQAVFVGRDRQRRQIADAVADAARAGGVVAIHAIDGMPGIGKTTFAIHVAHRLKDRFGDRQLFVDLHAHTHGRQPVPPGDALAELLTADGMDPRLLPATVGGRAAMWRDRTAGRRLLLILDNAAGTEQVTPLLPGSRDCLVLITSRRNLGDLHAAVPIPLDVLAPDEAVEMFVRLAPRAAADRQAVAGLVRACGYLPLAISITASLYLRHRSWGLSDLLAEVHRSTAGLLTATAETRTVAAVFDLSYTNLAEGRQRFFRMLGLHPGLDIEVYAAAALAGTTLPHAEEHLDGLHGDHLLDEPAYRRYRMHDLIHAHAAATADSEEPLAQRRAALGRLLDYYQHAAAMAMDVLHPYERHRRPAVPAIHGPAPDLSTPDDAATWLDTELANLLTAGRHAAHHGFPGHAWRLSAILERHMRLRGRYRDAESLHLQALEAARAVGDRCAEADALIALGHVHRMLGGHDTAAEHYERAWQLAKASEHRSGETDALIGLGHIHRQRGRFEQALDRHEHALKIARDIGHRSGELHVLNGLGDVHWLLGHYEEAAGQHRLALGIARDIGHRSGELQALNGIGQVLLMLGRHEQAGEHFHSALEIAAGIGDRSGQLQALNGLGHVHRALDRLEQAADCYRRVRDLARDVGSGNWQFEALQALGRLYHDMGRTDLAITHHEHALRYATHLAQPADQARAHDGLAHAHRACGGHARARWHWQRALDILTALGTEHTEEAQASVSSIRAHLAAYRD